MSDDTFGDAPGIDELLEFDFLDAISEPYIGAFGTEAGVALLVFFSVVASVYIRTGSVVLPVGLAMLTGGATIALIPGVGMAWLVLVILLTGGGVLAFAYYRFSR